MSEIFPVKIQGPKKQYFLTISQLTSVAGFTAYIFSTKHDIHNRASVLETTRGLLHLLKISWTLVHKRLKIGHAFLPTLCKFCILLYWIEAPVLGGTTRAACRL